MPVIVLALHKKEPTFGSHLLVMSGESDTTTVSFTFCFEGRELFKSSNGKAMIYTGILFTVL